MPEVEHFLATIAAQGPPPAPGALSPAGEHGGPTAGVRPTSCLIRFDGQVHGFFGLLDEHLSVSATAHAQVAAALRTAFAQSRGDPP